MLPKAYDCPTCKKPMSGDALARAITEYSPATHLHVTACPNCGSHIECRAYGDALELGYTYWAGSLHFEAVVKLAVPGLARAQPDGALQLKGVCIFTPPGT